jgi:hypothetical protein
MLNLLLLLLLLLQQQKQQTVTHLVQMSTTEELNCNLHFTKRNVNFKKNGKNGSLCAMYNHFCTFCI